MLEVLLFGIIRNSFLETQNNHPRPFNNRHISNILSHTDIQSNTHNLFDDFSMLFIVYSTLHRIQVCVCAYKIYFFDRMPLKCFLKNILITFTSRLSDFQDTNTQ